MIVFLRPKSYSLFIRASHGPSHLLVWKPVRVHHMIRIEIICWLDWFYRGRSLFLSLLLPVLLQTGSCTAHPLHAWHRFRGKEEDGDGASSEWKATVCLRGRTRRARRGGAVQSAEEKETLTDADDDGNAADHRESAPLVYLLGSTVIQSVVQAKKQQQLSRNQTLCLETGFVLIFSSYYLDLILSLASSTYSSLFFSYPSVQPALDAFCAPPKEELSVSGWVSLHLHGIPAFIWTPIMLIQHSHHWEWEVFSPVWTGWLTGWLLDWLPIVEGGTRSRARRENKQTREDEKWKFN